MLIITGYIAILVILRLVTQKKRNTFILFASIGLFVIAAFRSPYFGPDTLRYVNRFDTLQYINFSVFWNNFINFSGKDPAFYLLAKIISMIGINAQGWLAILSSAFIFSISKMIKRYSDEPYISFIALISLGYFYFTLTGLRQGLALSIVLLSYDYLKHRKLLPFIITVIIASAFHSSALIFLIAYPIVKLNVGLKYIVGAILAFAISLFWGNAIHNLVGVIGWTENLSAYSGGGYSLSYTGFIIQLVILSFCLIYKKDLTKNNDDNKIIFNLMFIGLIFQAFSSVIAEFFRISIYFSIFSILLIPNAIFAEKDKKLKIILYFAVLAALIGYIFWSSQFTGFKFFI